MNNFLRSDTDLRTTPKKAPQGISSAPPPAAAPIKHPYLNNVYKKTEAWAKNITSKINPAYSCLTRSDYTSEAMAASTLLSPSEVAMAHMTHFTSKERPAEDGSEDESLPRRPRKNKKRAAPSASDTPNPNPKGTPSRLHTRLQPTPDSPQDTPSSPAHHSDF